MLLACNREGNKKMVLIENENLLKIKAYMYLKLFIGVFIYIQYDKCIKYYIIIYI
jgi:hypothetical protein